MVYILTFYYFCAMRWLLLIIFFSVYQLGGCVTREQFFHWKPVCPSADSLVILLESDTYNGLSYGKRLAVVHSLYTLAAVNPHLPVLKSRAQYWNARLLISKSELDSALCLVHSGVQLLDTLSYCYDYERFLSLEAMINLKKGNWTNYYNKMKKLEMYYEKEKDAIMLASTYINIGNYLKDIEEHERALEYLSKADSLYEVNKLDKYRIKNHLNLSNVLYSTGQKDKAISLLLNLLDEPEAKKDTVFYINVLFSIHNQTENIENADKYAERAYRLSSVLKNDFLQAKAAVVKGENLYKKNEKDSALFYYKYALEYARQSNNYDFILPALRGVINVYSSRRIWDSAFAYQQEYISIRDSLNQIKNVFLVNQMEAQIAQKRYESELAQAEKDMLMHKRIINSLVIFGILIILFVWYVFETLRNKEKVKKQLKILENKEIAARLKNEQLRNEHFQLEIDAQNKELASNALMVSEKNRLLDQLVSRIEAMRKEGNMSEKNAAELVGQIKGDLVPQDDWIYFKLHFEKVHPDFFSKLKEVCTDLSEGELRLCAYIRIGIENKQIAQMLSVQPDTVKTSRYRIRRKLKLRQEDSLEDFLRSI